MKFNIGKFNKGKFNISNSSINNTGIAALELTTTPAEHLLDFYKDIESDLLLETEAEAFINIYAEGEEATLLLETEAEAFIDVYAEGNEATLLLETDADMSLSDEEIINLSDLVLAPGDVLIIDTCSMTITINSENGMKYFKANSEFFELLPGINEIVYSDSVDDREILMDVIWKDKYV